ncbi:CGNR zinc finger domain-containing protein [Streptosporangium sandarakinum]|uniref:Putative RNA-binding Zn ribbon-like protein n=1 Tax=Streptosporangium sandarakinum TaxID=1260955 RepID=A0A852V0C1_9ACTN|nr:CGNR zinc finger domain-containing protein [Streptosporangium sandarakinum]NYF39245.1 putative RNA-binding Zn ribbon-like protein [Streptosporangium sandarakinum]
MNDPAALVCDFVNTYDVESGTDAVPSPAALAAWLAGRGLAAPSDTATGDDLALAVALRETLREALRRNHDARAADAPDGSSGSGGPDGPVGDGAATGGRPGPPSRVFAGLPLRVTLTAGGPALEPAAEGVPAGLARIAAAVMAAHAAGMWPRLKVCTESTCQWAFVDSSKNRSRSWCSMRVCGNRTKTRAYRARRQAETGSRHLRAGFPDTV